MPDSRPKVFHVNPWFDSLANAMNVGVMVLNPDAELDFVSRKAVEILRCEDEEDARELWPQIRSSIQKLQGDEGVDNTRGRRIDTSIQGNSVTIRLRIELFLLAEDDCQGYMLILKDRQSLDRLENDLRMASRFRMLNRVFTAVTHDLKTPLNALAVNVGMLRDAVDDQTVDKAEAANRQDRYLRIIDGEILRLREMLNDLLGETVVRRNADEAFDVRELMLEIVTLMQPQAKQQAIEIQHEVPENPIKVTTRRDYLKEALLNVVVNALEAMPQGGELSVTLDFSDETISIGIQDSGPGIPKEIIESIYEMHFTTKPTGSGIGLYIAKQVITALAGAIGLETKTPGGTTFTITVPRHREAKLTSETD